MTVALIGTRRTTMYALSLDNVGKIAMHVCGKKKKKRKEKRNERDKVSNLRGSEYDANMTDIYGPIGGKLGALNDARSKGQKVC